MKRTNAPWSTGTTRGPKGLNMKEMITKASDHFSELLGLENAFAFAWAVAQELERRWNESGQRTAMPVGNLTQKLLADFAIASLTHQHRNLHDAAVKYQTHVLQELQEAQKEQEDQNG